MTLDELLQKLWQDYSSMNKQAHQIHALLEEQGEKVRNDHIAFRTFNIPKVGIDALAKSFVSFGYEPKGEYQFSVKKLFAKHFEHPDEAKPKIFISELKLEEFSSDLQSVVTGLVNQVDDEVVNKEDFSVSGVAWDAVTYETYLKLKEESEYAAWLALFGFRANHFTVLQNSLKNFDDLAALNQFLKDNGFKLNSSGGEIKGSEKDFLAQSSTMADPIEIQFKDKKDFVPGCYYEFAQRYPMENGQLFSGFVAQSADKIFESTDNK